MATRTWTLKIRGDERDALRAADKVERRFQKLDINKGLKGKLQKFRKDFDLDDKGWNDKLTKMSESFKKFAGGLVSSGKPLAITAGTALSANFIGSVVSGLASGAAKVAHGVAAIAALLPAAALAGGLAFGALKLAVSGVGDALKAGFEGDAEKFAEATKGMSRSAKEFLGEVVALKPELSALRKQVQEKFFAPFTDDVQGLATAYLPALNAALGSTAFWFGKAAGRTAEFLQTPAVVSKVSTALFNANVAASNLAVGIPHLVAAFLPLVTVGSTFLPSLTGGFERATMRLASFMQQAERTGELRAFIQGGLDKLVELWETTKQLGRIFEDIGGIVNKVFPNMGTQAGGLLDTIERAADSMNRFLETARGGEVANTIFGTLWHLTNAFLGTLQHVATTLGRAFGPVVPDVVAFLSALTDVKFAIVTALEPVLTIMGQGISGALQALTGLLNFVSGNKVAIAGLTGVVVAFFLAWAAAATKAAVMTTLATWPVLLIGVALGALALLVSKHWGTIQKTMEPVVSWFGDTAAPVFQGATDLIVAKFQDLAAWVRTIWPQISEAIGHVLTVIGTIIRFYVGVYTALWQRFGGMILDFAQRAWGAVSQYIQGVLTFIRGIIQLVLAIINGDWGKAWEAIKTMAAGVWQGIQAIIDLALATIRLIIGLALQGIWVLMQVVWNGILATIGFVWGLILGVIRLNLAIITAALALGWNIIWATVTTVWNAIWTSITFVWGLITGSVRSQIDALKLIIQGGLAAISGIWNYIWGGMSSALGAIWDGIKSGVTTGVNAVIDVINWFIRLLNNIPGVDIGEIGKVGQRGGGGRARGAGGTERGLAYARGGITDGPQYLVGEGNRTYPEAVIATDPKYRQRNLGLLSWAADRMGVPMGFERGGIPGFQIGGIIETLAGPIGTAIGQKAVDLGQELASGVGMRALNEGRDIVKGMVDRIPGPFGYVRDMGKGVVDKMHEHAKGIIEAMEASGGGPGANAGYGGGGVERWRGTALQALAMTGSPASWIGSLLRRMNQESGGNPNAINLWDSNARRGDPSGGLMQNIRSAYASRVAGFPSLRGTNFFHPLGSIVASIVYTKGRYGSGPAGWDRPGGYKSGGVLGYKNGGVLPEDVMGVGASGQRYKFHRAERITSAPQAGSDGAPRLVVEGDIVIHANDREGGRQAAKGYMGYLAERGIIVDAKIA